jgi:hypothetical protein
MQRGRRPGARTVTAGLSGAIAGPAGRSLQNDLLNEELLRNLRNRKAERREKGLAKRQRSRAPEQSPINGSARNSETAERERLRRRLQAGPGSSIVLAGVGAVLAIGMLIEPLSAQLAIAAGLDAMNGSPCLSLTWCRATAYDAPGTMTSAKTEISI